MKVFQLFVGIALVAFVGAVSSVQAQKGMGDGAGIAQSTEKPTLFGGRSAGAVIPSLGSGRYSPGPNIVLPSWLTG